MENQKKLHKEIDLIEGVINRMANNSFMIKGWTLTIVGVVFALTNNNPVTFIVVTGIAVVIISFWCLDTFYLRTERKYRALYTDILSKTHNKKYNEIDWYNLDTKKYEYAPSVGSFKSVMWSKTIWPFYFLLLLIVLFILIVSIILK
ncbi:MAG: hypothetical protein M0P01_08680 [Treponema sp.]|nr:hypothetical protein [Treponema sp.]